MWRVRSAFKSPFLRNLERVLTADLREELRTTVRVAALLYQPRNFTNPEICDRLGISITEVNRARRQIKRAMSGKPSTRT
jgi:Trp operon repressor